MQSGGNIMEFDNVSGWAFGVISKRRGEISGQIKALALIDENKKISKKLDEEGSLECFPPSGYVFAPSLLSGDDNLGVGDSVIFRFEENKQKKNDEHDSFIISPNTLSKKGYMIHPIANDFIEAENYLKINELQHLLELSENILFFLGTSDSVIGEFKVNMGEIRPKVGKEAKVWRISDCNIIEWEDALFLYDIPGSEIGYTYIDCMDSKQLSEWFREQLKKIDPAFIKQLDDTTKWREELPKKFDDIDAHIKELNKTRLKRIMTILENIEFTRGEIEVLSNNFPDFKKVYETKIEYFKEEYRNEFKREFEERRKKQNQEISDKQKEIQKLENDISKRKKELKKLDDLTTEHKETLNHLETNKERLLKDFSILQSVTNPNAIQPATSSNSVLSYVIEEEKPLGTHFEKKEDFLERLKYFLNRYKVKEEISKRLLNVAASFHCFVVPEVSFAIAFAEAVGNTKYIIRQVEPDWLHFKNFWENGLGVLWDSSHKEPDTLHLLVLEDINLASPECWGRPLFDILAGLRKKIPYGKTSWPSNLKIAATWLPSDNPKIGLPLYKRTFSHWGAVILNDFRSKQTGSFNLKEGYIMPQQLDEWKPDELEIDHLRDDISKIMDFE
jgi:archaellum component FlaC